MNKIGHFGTPALVAGGLTIVLLVMHLAVPFGVFDFNKATNDAGQKDDTISRGDMADAFDASNAYGPASPGVTLGGIIMAMVAGLLLVVVGFVPMPVVVARFAGWTLALVGAVGGFMALTSSAYWLGTGFTTLLNVITPNPDPVQRLWIISPVLVFIGAAVLIMTFFKVMAGVVATRDGLRTQAEAQLKGAAFAAVFLALVLIVPWSMQILSGDETRAQGVCSAAESCSASYNFFTAFGHSDAEYIRQSYTGQSFGGVLGIADTTEDAEPGMFQGLALSLKVMTATGWIGFLLGALATLGPVLSSAFKLPGAAKWSSLVQAAALPMALWATIMWILASSYMWRPSWEEGAIFGNAPIKDFQLWVWPGAPVFAGAVLVIWALMQAKAVRPLFESHGGVAAIASKNAHSFD